MSVLGVVRGPLRGGALRGGRGVSRRLLLGFCRLRGRRLGATRVAPVNQRKRADVSAFQSGGAACVTLLFQAAESAAFCRL